MIHTELSILTPPRPEGSQQEVGLLVGGQVARAEAGGGGAAVSHGLAATQGVEVVKVES